MGTPLNGSILKGFEILSLFSEGVREVTAVTVSEKLGANTATAHRLLMTLEHAGALQAVRRGAFVLGPTIEELGLIAEETNPLGVVLQPELDRLSGVLNESVMATRLSRRRAICIAVANSNRPISVSMRVGTHLPLAVTAQGRIWLAEMTEKQRTAVIPADEAKALTDKLDQVKAQGYALNLGDNEPDIAAVSVPVRNDKGRVALTLSTFGMLSRFNEAFLDTARDQLLAAAERVGEVL